MKQQRKDYNEVRVKAIEIACEVSFADALKYAHEELEGRTYHSDCLFEEFLYMDPNVVRAQMYENLLEKPYIYWLERFIDLEYERAADRSPFYKINYRMYNKYSEKEIKTRLIELLCAKNNFSDAIDFLKLGLDDILHARELEIVWKAVVNYYANTLENEDGVDFMIETLENWGHGCKIGYYTMLECAIENLEKIIPYLDEWYESYKIKEVLLRNLKAQNAENIKLASANAKS